MAIVGFNFTKINAERTAHATGKININNNVRITNVEKQDLAISSTKEDGIKFTYEFVSNFEPNIGKMKFEGEILVLEPKENVKKILDDWKKTKKIGPAMMTLLLNALLTKCNIKALVLSQEINLPAPIPLPKVQVEKKAPVKQ